MTKRYGLRSVCFAVAAGLGIGFTIPSCVAAQGAFADRFRVEAVGPDVYAIIRTRPLEEAANSNTLVVVNDDDVVVVDTNIDPATARAVIGEIRKLTDRPVRYVINTHWHDDHVIGNSVYRAAYPGVEFVAHPITRTEVIGRVIPSLEQNRVEYPRVITRLEEQLRTGKKEDGTALEESERARAERLLGIYRDFTAQMPAMSIVPPTLTVDSQLTLHRGEREIRVLHLGLGNTPGDLVVYLPRERVLATGDLVVSPVPFSFGSYIGEWIDTLERVRAFDVAVIVPGHGEPMRDESYIMTLQQLLASLNDQMRAAVARGLTLEQARSEIDLSTFRQRLAGSDPRLNTSFDRNFFTPATERAYLEAKGEPRMPPARAAPAADGSARSATRLYSIDGFDIPESVQYDPDLDLYFVSNVTAHAVRKDNTGFISRIRPDGAMESLKFIEGGRHGVALHAPKGLAFRGDTLWVVDVDSVRAFDKRTGHVLGAIDLTPLRPILANDLAFDPSGAMYISDTGLQFNEPSGSNWTTQYRIFRRTTGGRAELVLQDSALSGPNGVMWDTARSALLIGSGRSTRVLYWRPGEPRPTVFAEGGGGYDGLTRSGAGRLFLSSQSASTIEELMGGRAVTLFGGLPSPGDIGYDTRRERLLVPLLGAGRVEVWQVGAQVSGSWSAGPPMLFARSAHAVVATSEAIYALGGSGAGGRAVMEVERFDGAAWGRETTLPDGLNAPAAAVIGSRIYVIGGFSGTSNIPTDKVHVYDTRTKRWSEAASLPAPRGGHAAVVRAGRIHVFGGGNNRSTIADHSVYDPSTDSWSERASLPRAEGSPAGVVFEDNVWAIGGRSGASDFGDVYIYDAATDQWRQGPPIEPRGTAGAVLFDGTIWLLGGESQAQGTTLDSVLRLNPARREWADAPPIPTARNDTRAVVFQDALWTVGGSTTAGMSHSSAGSAIVERLTRTAR